MHLLVLIINTYPLVLSLCFQWKKEVEETDDRMTQFKKKAKELRILDAKTAQNLCKLSALHIICVP